MSLSRLSAALHNLAHAQGNSDDAAQAIAELIDERNVASARPAPTATGMPDEISVFEHGAVRELMIEQERGPVWIAAGTRPVTRYVRVDVAEAKARAVIRELEATAPVLAAVRAALGAQPGESTEDAAKRVAVPRYMLRVIERDGSVRTISGTEAEIEAVLAGGAASHPPPVVGRAGLDTLAKVAERCREIIYGVASEHDAEGGDIGAGYLRRDADALMAVVRSLRDETERRSAT